MGRRLTCSWHYDAMVEDVAPPSHRAVGVVEAVAKLGFYLPVNAACLGTTTAVSIGPIKAEVVLPNLTVVSDELFYVSAPEIHSVPVNTDWEERLQDHAPWGTIKSYRKNNDESPNDIAVWLSRILIRVFVESEDREDALVEANKLSDQLNKHLQSWLGAMGDWFEAVSATYLPRSPKLGGNRLISSGDPMTWFFDGTTATSLNYVIGGRLASGIGGPSVDLSCWHQILAATGKGLTPPDEHLLLRDSLEAIFENHARRAILDAATAAEISLAALLDKEIKLAAASERQAVRKRNNNIGRLTRTLRKYGISIRADVQKDLADCRNKAIHAGLKPSLEEARLAREIATEIVEMANPKGTLLDPYSNIRGGGPR